MSPQNYRTPYIITVGIVITTAFLILLFSTFDGKAEVSPPIQISENVACQIYDGGLDERNIIVDFFMSQDDRELLDYQENYEGYDIYFESKVPLPDTNKIIHVEHRFKGNMFCWKVLSLTNKDENT